APADAAGRGSVSRAGTQRRRHRAHVVDTATPGPAARLLEHGPEPRVLRQVRIGSKISAWRARGQHAGAFFRPVLAPVVADQIDAALELPAVDDDADTVAFAHLPHGPAGQRLRPHVADTGAGGHAREARVGDHRDLLAPREVLQRRGDLVDLLHPRAEGGAADQHQDVAGLEALRSLALD